MNYLKWALITMILIAITQAHSRPRGTPEGYNCYHNGELYISINDYQNCPSPHSDLTDNDPNDHDCIIIKLRRYMVR